MVHEAFLRLVEQQSVTWESRSQFKAIAAQMMRRVLTDHARKRAAAKRGSDPVRVELDEEVARLEARNLDVVALDEALEKLEALDARQARLVELRFFAGLTIAETAEVIQISPATVKRDWETAKAWLARELRDAS